MILSILSFSSVQAANFLSFFTSSDIGSEEDFPQIVPPQLDVDDSEIDWFKIGELLPPETLLTLLPYWTWDFFYCYYALPGGYGAHYAYKL